MVKLPGQRIMMMGGELNAWGNSDGNVSSCADDDYTKVFVVPLHKKNVRTSVTKTRTD
jgi:hypothetical protein